MKLVRIKTSLILLAHKLAASDATDNDGSVDLSEPGPDVVTINDEDRDEAPGLAAPKQFSDIHPLRWRRVRRVKLVYSIEQKRYFVFCSCKRCEGTCFPCVHQMNTMELFGPVRLRDLDWHPRVSNGYYYSALVSNAAADFDPMQRFHPHLSEVSVQEWREVNEKHASRVGVPDEGLLDANFEHVVVDGGDVGDGPSGDDGAAQKSKRTPAYNAAFAQRMHYAIAGALSASSPFWREYCEFQKRFFENISRRAVTFPGVGASNRLTGVADIAQGRGNSAKRPQKAVQAVGAETDGGMRASHQLPFGWSLTYQGQTEAAARKHLKKWGALDSWIVEVYPDDEHPGYVATDRWFMKVIEGLVQGPKDKEFITACRWLTKNSVTRMDADYPNNEPCEILRVKAYGPPRCPLFDLQAAAATTVVQPVVHPAPVARSSAQSAARHSWGPAQTYNQNVQIFLTKKIAASVETVSVSVLRDAMMTALVPGVHASSSKHSDRDHV